MAERKLRLPTRVLGLGMAVGIAAGACSPSPEAQIYDFDLVNCDSGPKSGSIRFALPAGESLNLSKVKDLTSSYHEVVIFSRGNGAIEITRDLGGSFNYHPVEGAGFPFRENSMNLSWQGNISFVRGGVVFNIQINKGAEQKTRFDVSLECIETQSPNPQV